MFIIKSYFFKCKAYSFNVKFAMTRYLDTTIMPSGAKKKEDVVKINRPITQLKNGA